MDSSASKNFELTAAVLHIIAMTLMLMDHLWATLLPAREWLTCAGRVFELIEEEPEPADAVAKESLEYAKGTVELEQKL